MVDGRSCPVNEWSVETQKRGRIRGTSERLKRDGNSLIRLASPPHFGGRTFFPFYAPPPSGLPVLLIGRRCAEFTVLVE